MENKLIKFHETELVAVVDDAGNQFVAVKPISDAIGLDAHSATKGIKTHPILGAEVSVHTLQVGENQKREYLTLPIERLNGWLFSIDIKKVRPEARQNLIIYQKECYRVLYQYFFGVTRNVISRQRQRFDLQNELKQIETSISHLSNRKKEIYKQLEAIDHEIFVQLEFFPHKTIEIQ